MAWLGGSASWNLTQPPLYLTQTLGASSNSGNSQRRGSGCLGEDQKFLLQRERPASHPALCGKGRECGAVGAAVAVAVTPSGLSASWLG